MNPDIYKAVVDLIDIFANSTIDGEKVICYEIIKGIIDGNILKEKISPNEKITVNKQIIDSLEWLEGLGVTTKYKEEIMAFFR